MKILILDDEVMLRSSIREYLESMGHVVIETGDGEAAARTIGEQDFDLLLLDVNVPKMDGFSLLDYLHRHHVYTPVIFITALVDIEDVDKGFTLGCSDYLKKPFHLRELGLRIENLIRMQALSAQNHLLLGKYYSYDRDGGLLCFQSEPQTLTKKQQQIIDILVRNLGIVVDFDTFRNEVWNGEEIDNASIRAEISRFKRSLREPIVKNIRGLGYKIDRFC